MGLGFRASKIDAIFPCSSLRLLLKSACTRRPRHHVTESQGQVMLMNSVRRCDAGPTSRYLDPGITAVCPYTPLRFTKAPPGSCYYPIGRWTFNEERSPASLHPPLFNISRRSGPGPQIPVTVVRSSDPLSPCEKAPLCRRSPSRPHRGHGKVVLLLRGSLPP